MTACVRKTDRLLFSSFHSSDDTIVKGALKSLGKGKLFQRKHAKMTIDGVAVCPQRFV